MPIEFSVVLAGKYGVGKSCIFQRLKTGQVPDGVIRGTSRSVNSWGEEDGGMDTFVYERKIADKKIKVTLWDTGGQERYDSMTANYYRNAHAVIFVYAVDEEATLFALNDWVAEAKQMNRQSHLVMCLWGTKSDLPTHTHAVREDAVESFVNLHHIPEHLNCTVNVLDDSTEEAMMTLLHHMDKLFNTAQVQPLEERNDEILQLCEPTTAQPTFQERCCGVKN